ADIAHRRKGPEGLQQLPGLQHESDMERVVPPEKKTMPCPPVATATGMGHLERGMDAGRQPFSGQALCASGSKAFSFGITLRIFIRSHSSFDSDGPLAS